MTAAAIEESRAITAAALPRSASASCRRHAGAHGEDRGVAEGLGTSRLCSGVLGFECDAVGLHLERMTRATAAALLEGTRPIDVEVAEDYPTEFSQGVAAQVANGSDLGPYVIYPRAESVVVGEIGGALTGPGTVEIGYAVVRSRWGRGIATEAVRELLNILRKCEGVERVVAHTPLSRPESVRVVEKAGFTFVREIDDSHEGEPIRVKEWEFRFGSP